MRVLRKGLFRNTVEYVNENSSGGSLAPATITSNSSITSNMHIIYLDASNNNINLSLPIEGDFVVKRIDSSENDINIIPPISIDDNSNISIKYKNTCLHLIGYNGVYKIT